ncbi:MAG: DUF4440 domain-containing protein [Marinilabiliales bacterium]|nr:MAG: DUF4440 domain-containing protein [Marinilabiliales bacterium]
MFSCNNENADIVATKTILSILEQQQNDWNNGNIEAYMQAYWKSPQLRFASGDKITFGWQKTFSNYKKSYPDKETMGELHFTELKVEIINETDAVVFGRWKLFRKSDSPNGLFTLRFHKFDEGWKIISDHTS